jgi:S-adenosyl-L-methionine hydrolase (adenosine-forming)
MSVITLLSDFGAADHYVAAMKGVILQTAPKAVIVDITHRVAPQNLLQGAFVLRQTFEYFPAGTIHVAVVDPGVGTARPIIAARYSGQFVLAPDNGLVSLVHSDFVLEELRVVQNEALFRRSVSATFHGRDIFAPVAGHILKTGRLADVGPPTDKLSLLSLPVPVVAADGRIVGQILYVDTFGNATTNVSGRDLERASRRRLAPRVKVGAHDVGPLRGTYGDVPAGAPVAILGSANMLEIAVNHGSASEQLGLAVGQEVILE